jgi:hypothetical protein
MCETICGGRMARLTGPDSVKSLRLIVVPAG